MTRERKPDGSDGVDANGLFTGTEQAQAKPKPTVAAAPRSGLRGLLARLAELSQLRLELLTTDIELSALQFLAVLALTLGAVLLTVLGLALLITAGLLAAPEGWRWLVALVLGLTCWLGTWLLLRRAERRLESWRPMAATLAELRRDRELL